MAELQKSFRALFTRFNINEGKAVMNMSPMELYWFEISDLTIHEAAFWMETGSNPRKHKMRCDQEDVYESYYLDHPGGAESVEKKCEVIFSAIRTGHINVTDGMASSNDALNYKRLIRKTDWISWCRDNGYTELANNFERGPEDSQAIAAKKEGASVPGEMPRTAIGKLAIKTAWEIELTTAKQATAKQVIGRLEELIETEPMLLERIPHGIRWMTTNTTEADFSIEACAKALSKWKLTRP